MTKTWRSGQRPPVDWAGTGTDSMNVSLQDLDRMPAINSINSIKRIGCCIDSQLNIQVLWTPIIHYYYLYLLRDAGIKSTR